MTSDSDDEMKRELERLRAENETLKQTKSDNISFKVGQKGGMSMYGLGRFPVTLYKSQWLILLDTTDKIKEFLKDREHELKRFGFYLHLQTLAPVLATTFLRIRG